MKYCPRYIRPGSGSLCSASPAISHSATPTQQDKGRWDQRACSRHQLQKRIRTPINEVFQRSARRQHSHNVCQHTDTNRQTDRRDQCTNAQRRARVGIGRVSSPYTPSVNRVIQTDHSGNSVNGHACAAANPTKRIVTQPVSAESCELTMERLSMSRNARFRCESCTQRSIAHDMRRTHKRTAGARREHGGEVMARATHVVLEFDNGEHAHCREVRQEQRVRHAVDRNRIVPADLAADIRGTTNRAVIAPHPELWYHDDSSSRRCLLNKVGPRAGQQHHDQALQQRQQQLTTTTTQSKLQTHCVMRQVIGLTLRYVEMNSSMNTMVKLNTPTRANGTHEFQEREQPAPTSQHHERVEKRAAEPLAEVVLHPGMATHQTKVRSEQKQQKQQRRRRLVNAPHRAACTPGPCGTRGRRAPGPAAPPAARTAPAAPSSRSHC